MASKRQIYSKISKSKGKGVKIPFGMCFYNPKEVYEAITQKREIVEWLNFISNHYIPPKNDVLLIYPCSNEKPYHKSRSYLGLQNTLKKLGKVRKHIHLITISEPFGLIPEEYYDTKEVWYDCPGLFNWWCRRYNQPYDYEYLEKSIQILSSFVSKFFEKVKKKKRYSKIIGFVRSYSSKLNIKEDHTHRRILEMASKISDIDISILPPKQVISNIVKKRGRFAWDMYGVSHPLAQDYLFERLKEELNERN